MHDALMRCTWHKQKALIKTAILIRRDSHLPFLSNIWSVYVTPAAPVLPPVVPRDVHLSFRLWYEAVASSNKGAGGGRSPVDANTVELCKR